METRLEQVRSLGCATDLMLIGWDGTVDDYAGAIRARSPANPDFFFGNFLLFRDAPAPGEAAAWISHFARAFEDDPRIGHVCVRWDRPDGSRGAADELAACGFELEETVVLTTSAPRPVPSADGIVFRRIDSDRDWSAVTALQVATMSEMAGRDASSFATRQVARHRGFVSEGRGAWFGAFVGDDLAADLGVFVENGVARFQAVETAARFRRRGICRLLLHHVSRVALDDLGARRLVIVGLPDHTAHAYASVGFVECERLVAAVRRPAR